MIIYVLLFLCSMLAFLYYYKKQSDYWKNKNVIQANGVIWKFIIGNRSLPEHIKDVYEAHDTHVGIFFGSIPALIVKDLQDIQAVLAGDFQSFYKRGFELNPNDLLTDNLLFIDDYKRWKCIRQKLSPVFTSSKLKNMFYILDKCAKDFVDLLNNDENMRKKPFLALYTYTTASLGAAVFGIDTTSTKSTMDSPFIDMAWRSVEPSIKLNAKVVINRLSPTLFRWLNLRLFGEFEEFFIGAVRRVIETRRNITEKKHDFIEICLELQKEGVIQDPQTGYEIEPTVEVLAAQAFFFFIAGVDTSANTIHFVLLELAGQPNILKKVHEEIDSVFNNVESLTYNDIEKMQYLDMVLSESMRMYPGIASIQRQCTKDTVLPGSKVKLEKGAEILIPIFGIHRDERFYPNPNVFDPERFAPENISQIKHYSYLPFGEGNRICIGNRFARLQVKAALAWLLRTYTLVGEKYSPNHFEKSAFALRDTHARLSTCCYKSQCAITFEQIKTLDHDIFVLILLCVILIYLYNAKQSDYWKKRNVVQVHGVLWKFMMGNRSLPEHIKEVYDAHDSHVGIFFGTLPSLIVKDLEDVQAVLTSDFQSFHRRGFDANPSDILVDNLLFIEDLNRWKCIRQKLSPVFTSSKLKNMFYILDKCAKDFVDLLNDDDKLREKPFNALYTYKTASIGATVFGIDTKSTKSTMDSPFMDMAWKSVEPSFKTNLKIFTNSVAPTLCRWLDLRIFGEFEDFFIGVVRNVIESRRNISEKRHDFIEICLELQKEGVIRDPQTGYEIEPTIEVLAAQAFFFFIAGADTSASTMHFFLLQLAEHQKILKKVHDEIDSIFENVESLSYYDVEKMHYLDMVLSESMRMYPTVGLLQRQCTRDSVLPTSKIRMEINSMVTIPVYGIHRDERFHPNPNVFNPERFAPENASQMKNYSYLPFGDGNRNCIGNRFARLQVKAALAWLLRTYTLAEAKYAPIHFEKSIIALRDTNALYKLIRRDI